jgi:hypothetical protein
MATTTEEILVVYKVEGANLKAGLQEMQAEMKKTEAAGVSAAKGTEDAFHKTETATKSLRTQLKELKSQLAEATDPKEVERLAKAAGTLKDKLDDATDAAKVFASESKFEQVGNALGSIAGKLRNLDFKGAADQSKLLLNVVKSITFKEALTGLKDLGTTLLNIGKSLITNPLFVVGAAIVGIGVAVDKVVTSFKDLEQQSKTLTDAIDAQNEALLTYNQRVEESNIKLRESLGIISKSQAEELRKQGDNNKERLELQKRFSKQIVDLAVETQQDLSKSTKGYFSESYTGDIEDLNRKKKFNRDRSLLEAAFTKEYIQLIKTQRIEAINARVVSGEEERKKVVDIAKKTHSEIKKIETDNTEQVIKDLYDTRDIDESVWADRVKRWEEGVKEWRDAEAEINAITEQSTEKYKKELDERLAADMQRAKNREDLEKESLNTVFSLYNSINQININRIDEQIAKSNELADSEIANLDRQLDARQISQKQYDEKRLAIEKKKAQEEADLKKKQFQIEKDAALVTATINTAQAVTKAYAQGGAFGAAFAALALAAGLAEIAVIQSQPTPKFEKGGKVKGKRHYAGGTIIEAEKDEFVVNRIDAIKNESLLEAINKGKANQHIAQYYTAPILKEQVQRMNDEKDKSFARNIANSILLNQSLNDKNILESLKRSRKNDQEIAHFLVKELAPKNNKYNW